MEIRQIYNRLLPELNRIAITDTHEHLLSEQEYLQKEANFFSLFFQHYASSDLISAGMDIKTLEYLRTSNDPVDKKWKKFSAYWRNMENTSFARVIKIAVKDLYDINEINESTISELCKKIQTKYSPGWYDYVLCEKAGIKKVFVRSKVENIKSYPDYFFPIVSSDQFLDIRSAKEIICLEEEYGIEIHSLKVLCEAIAKYYTRAKQNGAIGIKVTQAYKRTLRFDKYTFSEAEAVFNKMYYGMGLTPHWNQLVDLNPEERKPLIDFLMHEIVRLAGELGLVIQIHTGFQEGQGNYITNANPTHLTNLFLEYRKTRFDILHCGFPYYLELACLAKNFANVFPNMTWMYCIGSTVAERILSNWLDIIPVNKILGFGGDYHFVEGVYGHVQLARQSVTRVFSEKISGGLFTKKQVLEYGQKILCENAEAVYDIANVGNKR